VADFARLNGVKITKSMLNASKAPEHNVHYSIIDNRLYSKVILAQASLLFPRIFYY
jgi:hypothetical protein